MSGLLHLAIRLSAWLLRRHPLAGILDFTEEMQSVQAQARLEALSGGQLVAWVWVLREVSSLIAVIVRFKIFGRKTMIRNLPVPDEYSKPTPLLPALLSLLPFIIMGPVMLALGYWPQWTSPEWVRYTWPGEAILVVAVFWGGILLGARSGFPRWSFPFVMVGVVSLAALVNELFTRTPLHNAQLLWILVIAVLWGVLTWRWSVFRPFYERTRQDWTHLSYCFFALAMMLSASVDHDETPTLNLFVLLPSLLTLSGAFLHLRSASQRPRILALVLSLTAAMIFWIWPLMDGMTGSLGGVLTVLGIFIGFYFVLLGFLFAPALLVRYLSSRSGSEPIQ